MGFASTSDAAPTRKGPARHGTPTLKTDLHCTIEAFKDAAGTQPLESHPVNVTQMWLRLSVRNAGRLDARDVTSAFQVNRDGTTVYSLTQTTDLPAGFSTNFPLVKVNTHQTSTVTARIDVDTARHGRSRSSASATTRAAFA